MLCYRGPAGRDAAGPPAERKGEIREDHRAMPLVENGELIVPQAPGLGLLLDEDAIRRYTVG